MFPFARHGGARQVGRLHRLEELDQLLGLRGRHQLALHAVHVFLINEPVDDVGARGRGTEASFFHCVGQFFVVHQFARGFHGGKQRRFGVTRRRLRRFREQIGLQRFRLAAIFGLQRGQRFAILRIFLNDGAAINFEPARRRQHFPFGLELMLRDLAIPRRDIEFRRREKHGNEAARDHVVNFRFRVIEVLRFRRRRDDGEVIADLGVVEDAFVRPDPIVLQRLFRVRLKRPGKVSQSLASDRQIIFRQGARIRSRIGQHLVLFVERLRDLQGALGGKTETAVRFALQRRQIVEPRRDLRAGLLLLGDARDRVPLARRQHCFRRGPVPDAIGAIVLVVALLEIRPLIGPFVLALRDPEFRNDAPITARLEIADLQLAFVNDRERRRLHAPDRGDVAGPRTEHALGDRPGAVDADEPIAFAPRTGRVRQAAHLRFIAQMSEGVADGLRRHRLQPEAFHRVLVLRQHAKVIEDQFALAAGVAGVDDLFDVLAGDQLLQRPENVFGPVDRLKLEFFGNDRQRFEPPEAVFFLVDVLRHEQFRDMTHRRRDDVLVVLVVPALLRHFSQSAREVGSHAGLLGNDE